MKKSTAQNTRNSPAILGHREQQIVAAVAKLGEASVTQVMAEIPHPPTHTTIRSMMQVLARKNVLQFRKDGKRYLYRVKSHRDSIRTAAVKNLLATFFPDNISVAIATILDLAGDRLGADEITALRQKIDRAHKENKP